MSIETIRRIAAGTDAFGDHRGLGISRVDFKLPMANAENLFVLENTFRSKGGPARHLHYDQDEWFYCVEGTFSFEIGDDKFELSPGDSLFGPRKIPHVWAHVGNATGRILVVFAPAGKMESFFREVTKADAMPPQDPELWRSHGMELLGPPMKVA